ncbi:hypothetical protein AVEN_14865-1 [Araneus ventricosus]|uniref:Peptidase S1 domain-containing protein n=1 Tax=Araneus ventricosus TaxID=182803 RepID=A0A4Y2TGT4_ARAVE|nr:hypothetical protein AVEN_14865-1 [Araneus ventricosus]
MITQREVLGSSFGIMNRGPSNGKDGMYENSKSNVHRNKEELLPSSTSSHEVHYEVPLIQVSSQDTRARKSTPVLQRSFKKRSLDDKQQSGIAWSLPQNVSSKWNNDTSDGSDSFHKEMEEYVHMAQKIEKLIPKIGGMDVICKEYPELAQILIVELNKSCPPAQSSSITSEDWTATGQEGKSLSFKDRERMLEAKDSSGLTRKRKEAKEEESNWKELYYLSREYLRKLLYIMVSERPGEPLSHESLSKLPLYPPFSSKQLQAIIVRDPTIVDKNAALEITKGGGVTYSKDSITNETFKSSHSSYDSNLRSSNKDNAPRTGKDSISPPAVQLEGRSEQRGRTDRKFSDGSEVWDIRLDTARSSNKNESSEHLNSGIQTSQNGKQFWRTGNRKNASLEGGVQLGSGGKRHEIILSSKVQNANGTIHEHESAEEEGPPLNVFHIKVDHKTDYSKMLKTGETIEFEKDKGVKDLLDFRSEHRKADLKGGGKAHSVSGDEKAIDNKTGNKNEQVQLRTNGQGFPQLQEMAKDTTEAWVHYGEGNDNQKKVAIVSAMKTEDSRNGRGKISFRQGIVDTDPSDEKVTPETDVHSTYQADKIIEANIPHSLVETDFRTSKESKSGVDHVLNLKGRSADEEGDGKDGEEDVMFEFTDLLTEKSELVKNTPPPQAIHSNESMELLFNLRDGSGGNKENANVEFRSDILDNNTAKHRKTEINGENKEVRETIFRPTNSQQITEETKMRLTNDTMVYRMKRPEVENDSSQSGDLEGISTEATVNQTVSSKKLQYTTEASFHIKISESEALEMGFNHRNHEMEHSFHVDGKNNANDESSILFNVESQHNVHVTEQSLLHHRSQTESEDFQIDESQKSVFKIDNPIEFGNNHSDMEVKFHTNDQMESDVKLKESSSNFHINQETGYGRLDFRSDGKVASETGDHLADHLKGEMDLHSNISTHSDGTVDTSVALNDTVGEAGKNVTLTAAEVAKEQESNPYNVSSDAGGNSYKIYMETDDILANVKDSFHAGSELKITDQKELTENSDTELSATTLSPAVASSDDSQGFTISGGLKHAMKLKTGRGNLGMGIRIKREVGEPELSDPYDIFFHDNKSLPRPIDNQDNQYYQLTAATSANWNISSYQRNSSLSQKTGTKSKIVEKSSTSRGKANLKHKKINSIINLKTTSELSKDTRRKHGKNAISKTHTNKKGKGLKSYHKKGTTRSVKIKNNANSHRNKKQKKSGNELNKHQSPSKNTIRRHHKQMKHKTNKKKKHRKGHRHIRDLSIWPTTPTSENGEEEYQGNFHQMKPKKTLNLRILYGKEETPYKPPEINPFSDYNIPAEEDDFEKIVHGGYRKHLFNKGRFSVLHLTKNFKVYKPGEEESSEEDDDSIIGYRNDTSKNNPQFVIGGRNVEAPWPWVVGIYELFSMKFVCGGTLFDLQHVVSAAHCFARYSSNARFGVVIGNQFRWDKRPNSQPEKLHRVKQLFVHDGFTMECYCNDLAILRLEMPLDSTHVPACIPHYDPAGVGENATVLCYASTFSYGIALSICMSAVMNAIIKLVNS